MAEFLDQTVSEQIILERDQTKNLDTFFNIGFREGSLGGKQEGLQAGLDDAYETYMYLSFVCGYLEVCLTSVDYSTRIRTIKRSLDTAIRDRIKALWFQISHAPNSVTVDNIRQELEDILSLV